MTKQENPGEKIEKVSRELMKEGIPKRASTFAASMGYLRAQKKKNKLH
ncbi:hypothetical protein [Filobacillus milosensis]|nr:hypothetical protein [Filobacillus milosensis]